MSDYHQSARSLASHAYLHISLNDYYYARRRGTKAAKNAGPVDEEAARPLSETDKKRAEEWVDCVVRLAGTLVDAGLGDVQMLVEYELYREPGAKELGPVDVVLAGVHPRTRTPSFVLIELKRWSYGRPVTGNVLLADNGAGPKPHPAAQVDGYRVNMLKHLDLFGDSFVHLNSIAYLPNLTRHEDQWITDYSPGPHARAMTGMRPDEFAEQLREYLAAEDGASSIKALLNSPVSGSRPLEDEIGSLLRGTLKYNLIDAQREVYEKVADRLETPSGAAKDVFLVQGGAGTGKSVLAGELIKLAVRKGLDWAFVSGGRSSRETFKRNARPHGKRFIPLIQLAEKHEPDALDLVICDEAQAMPDYPVRNSFRAKRMKETSVEVVVSRGRVVVFLADDDQRVRPDEVWPPREIAKAVRQVPGVSLTRSELILPLRGASGRAYQTWVDRLLGAHDPEPLGYHLEDPFQVYVANSPAAMELFLRSKQDMEKLTARITAGFAFPWSKSTRGSALPDDVKIGGWRRPWNARDDLRSADVPPGTLWATLDGGFDQIGCIYTSRGLEYHWGGVIFGADLVWRSGRWFADPDASFDKKAKGAATHADYERQIRNAYQTMLKRSMAGTVVYSTDAETQALFRSLLPPLPGLEPRQDPGSAGSANAPGAG